MARGGYRVGSGRKPLKSKVVGMDGKPRGDVLPPSMLAPPVVVDSPLVEPPADLSEPRKAFWRAWAPHAIAEGTLTASKVLGFRSLSREFVIVEELALVIENKTHGWEDALKQWFKAEQRLDSTMARFKLTSLGKSEAKPKAVAANSWAAVAKR